MTGLPENWTCCRIADLAGTSVESLFSDGDWVESKDQDPDGTIRLTQLADVGEATFRDRSNRWLNVEQATRLGVTYLEEGDLLIARMPDPLGRCCRVPALPYEAVTVVDVAVLRVTEANPKFVMHMINSPEMRRRINEQSSGTTRKRISRKRLGALQFPTPPVAEQEEIVRILDTQLARLDTVLEAVQAVRDKADQFRRSRVKEAFGSLLAPRVPLTKVAGIQGGSTPSKLEDRLAETAREDRVIPFYKVGDLNAHPKDLGISRLYVAPSELSVLGINLIPKGAVVFPKRGGAIATDKKRRVTVPGGIDVNCMAAIPEKIDEAFLYWFFQSFRLSDIADGSVIPQINKRGLQGLSVPLPSEEEQRQIAQMLDLQIEKLSLVHEVLNRAELECGRLRRSLLQAAFTGELTKKWREANV